MNSSAAPAHMNLNNYIEKLRIKPQREREKIAVIATAVSFAIIFLIWLVSFNEMNKPVQSEAENQPGQLEDLKSDFSSDKASIEEMFRELPQKGSLGQDNSDTGSNVQETPSGSDNTKNDVNNLNDRSSESDGGIPRLP
ncbi:MAG: hypothetical protein COS72_04445 [Candidatus Moranbacteria bacterium CG06_land_8_20_14_3_00_43_56]|nr:MAG: hypothetical protein COS72_04445 [Candidatus Moranbacteria bacterium CG06_land_8_20_14_3_00_43_56]PIV84292.1 MAG: hypothetical protein COW51_00870 [Candidatus Moranbacteria bacterium CG17_big_fil_post_rev_8_21_14_2_50_44_12]